MEIVRELADMVGISFGSVQTILKNHLGLRRFKSRLVPKFLNFTALILREFFAKNSTHVAPQSPYSPDLAQCDFWLFPELKRPLRVNRFESHEEIERESARALKAIPTDDFSACFENWRKRWHSALRSGGLF